eukprot:PhM_4_TR11802/c0_g1_i1/m.4505
MPNSQTSSAFPISLLQAILCTVLVLLMLTTGDYYNYNNNSDSHHLEAEQQRDIMERALLSIEEEVLDLEKRITSLQFRSKSLMRTRRRLRMDIAALYNVNNATTQNRRIRRRMGEDAALDKIDIINVEHAELYAEAITIQKKDFGYVETLIREDACRVLQHLTYSSQITPPVRRDFSLPTFRKHISGLSVVFDLANNSVRAISKAKDKLLASSSSSFVFLVTYDKAFIVGGTEFKIINCLEVIKSEPLDSLAMMATTFASLPLIDTLLITLPKAGSGSSGNNKEDVRFIGCDIFDQKVSFSAQAMAMPALIQGSSVQPRKTKFMC